jgi:hypothetical protein
MSQNKSKKVLPNTEFIPLLEQFRTNSNEIGKMKKDLTKKGVKKPERINIILNYLFNNIKPNNSNTLNNSNNSNTLNLTSSQRKSIEELVNEQKKGGTRRKKIKKSLTLSHRLRGKYDKI